MINKAKTNVTHLVSNPTHNLFKSCSLDRFGASTVTMVIERCNLITITTGPSWETVFCNALPGKKIF